MMNSINPITLQRKSLHRLESSTPNLPAGSAPAGTRSEILKGALKQFARKGYFGSTVRDIATTVGITAGSLYVHYPSKEMMLVELIQIGQKEHYNWLRNAVLGSGTRPRDQLVALVSEHVRFHMEFSMLAVVLNAELHSLSEKLAEPILNLRADSTRLCADVIERGVQLGEFEVYDVLLTVTAISSMGVRVANWYTPDFHMTAEKVASEMAELACRMVKSSV